MAKPKTKGDPIQVRLPLDVDAAVRARALKQGVAPAVIIQGIVQNTYRKVAPIVPVDEARAYVESVIKPDDPACTHPKSKTLTSSVGLTRCACGAVRGVDGEWR